MGPPAGWSGAISRATAGQVMLSSAGSAVRPRVTDSPAWRSAELTTPARARLRVTHSACAVSQAGRRVAGAGGSDEAKRWTPEPDSVAWRLRQAWALAWLAISARCVASRAESDSRVVTT